MDIGTLPLSNLQTFRLSPSVSPFWLENSVTFRRPKNSYIELCQLPSLLWLGRSCSTPPVSPPSPHWDVSALHLTFPEPHSHPPSPRADADIHTPLPLHLPCLINPVNWGVGGGCPVFKLAWGECCNLLTQRRHACRPSRREKGED